MAKYRKKPVVIEAHQITEEGIKDWNFSFPVWLLKALKKEPGEQGSMYADESFGGFNINTLEGTLHVDMNDYVIQGVQGEIYPCKPDIFLETYERA